MTMQCSATEKITDLDRLTYLENIAENHIVEHIESCQYCLQTVAEFLGTDLLIQDATDHQDCPTMDDLVQYTSSISPIAKQIKSHLSDCAICQADIQLIQAQVFEEDAQIKASPIQDMLQSFGKRILEAVERPFSQPQIAFRGDSKDEHLYEIAPYQLFLKKTNQLKDASLWQLKGQLMQDELPYVGENILVQLMEGDKMVADTHLDTFGMFEFNNLPATNYNINIILKTELVHIPNLEIT